MSDISLKDKAYEIIRGSIIDCTYMPNQFLDETELMSRVGASRTPIREALNKLEQEGLIRIMPKRGVAVNDITLATLNEIFEIRLLVEPYMIRRYGPTIEKKELEKSISFYKHRIASNMSSLPDYDKDNDLHKMIYCTSHNTYLISMMDQIYAQNHRLRILSGLRSEERVVETDKEHIKILKDLIDEDYEAAAKAMEEHLLYSKEAAIRAMVE